MPMVELRGLSALEAWTRKVTQGYKDVKVHDLSTSWRDGLAFCALIHHFRPDLIDFNSLSKENILYNNRLAFQTAEKHLGVPSLLDAEDMFKHEEPDRLSVATYLSQFYECFEGPKSDRKHSITKSSPNTTTSSKTMDNITNSSVNSSDTTGATNGRPTPPKRDMKCQKCKTRVYILERLIIDDKCYHKTCFESLNIAVPDVCPPNTSRVDNDNENEINLNDINLEESCGQINTDNSIDPQSNKTIITDQIGVTSNDPIDRSAPNQSIHRRTSIESIEKSNKPEIPAKSFNIKRLKSVDNKTFENNSQKSDINSDHIINEPKITKQNQCQDLAEDYETTVPNVDKTTVDEVFAKVFGKSVTISDQINEIITAEESDEEPEEKEEEEEDHSISKGIYPDDKNPFGDEEEDEEFVEEDNTKVMNTKTKSVEYPDEKNPFGDEEEEDVTDMSNSLNMKKIDIKVDQNRRSSDALNPFGDDEDIDEQNNDSINPKPKPRQSLNVSNPSSAVPSPTSSLRSRKKRPAPTPPTSSTPSIPQVSSSCSLNSSFMAAVSGDSSRRDSIASCVSSDFGSSVPNSRTPTPLPRLKLQKSTEELSEDIQQISDENPESCDQNLSLPSVDSDSEQKKRSTSDLRLKKRPAPPIPVVKRLVKGSLLEIEEELNKIGDQLPGVEKKGKELEEILMKRLESEGQIEESDPLMTDFLSTAKERCRLGRRQKELMYMKREHKLEEIQVDIEYQMRCVISKQAAQKTEEDLKQEEELLKRLVEIIEERNDIVENMIKDENKEVEEYRRLVSKVMPTLPTNVDLKKAIKEYKISKHKNIDKNLVKFKDKLKLKDIKEKKKLKKLEKSLEKSAEKSDNSLEKSSEKSSDTNKSKHLTLKSTLKPFKKSLGLKSKDSDKKSDKKSSSTSSVVSDQNNDSNASKSDNKDN